MALARDFHTVKPVKLLKPLKHVKPVKPAKCFETHLVAHALHITCVAWQHRGDMICNKSDYGQPSRPVESCRGVGACEHPTQANDSYMHVSECAVYVLCVHCCWGSHVHLHWVYAIHMPARVCTWLLTEQVFITDVPYLNESGQYAHYE